MDSKTFMGLSRCYRERERGRIQPYRLHYCHIKSEQDKIFRRKRLSTGENFVLDYLEIYGTSLDIIKLNEFSNSHVKSNNNAILSLPQAIIIAFCKQHRSR